MAETIKIFELNIDVDAAIKSTSDLKKQSNDLKAVLDNLKKSGDTSSETYVKLEATYKNVNREYNASQTQIGKLINLQGQQIKTVQQGRNALTILNKEWAKATNLYGANSKEADELAKKHLELKNRVNELQKGVGDTTGNIGNYTESIVDAANKTGLFGKAQAIVNNAIGIVSPLYKAVKTDIIGIGTSYKSAIASTQGFSTAQKAAAIGTNLTSAALKLLKIALISTGIGAIIVLVGSLVAWFSKTQAGIDFVNKALAALGAAFNVIIDRVTKFGGIIFGLISGQKSLSEAWKEGKEAASGLGDEMAREIKLAIQLEAELQKLQRRQIATNVARSEINKQIKEQNKIAEDTTKSNKERQAAIEKAIALEQNQIAIENDLANNQLKNALQLGGSFEENRSKIDAIRQAFIDAQGDTEIFQKTLLNIGISETTVADVEKIGEAIISNNAKIEASEEKLTTLGNKKNTINQSIENERKAAAKSAQDAAKKAIDDAIKESQTRLKLFEEENKGQAKSLADGVALQEQLRDRRLAILQEEIKAGKKTKTEAELEELKIKNEFLDKQTELTIQFASQELEVFKASYQSRLEQGQLLTDALVAQEETRLNAIAEKEREFQAKRLEEGIISQQEYNTAIAEVDAEYKASKDELELLYKEQKAEADVIDFENEQALRIERDGLIFEAKLLELDRIKQAEIEAAQKVGADTTKIDARFSELRKQIKQEETNSKLNLQKDLFGGVAELLGKETIAGKAAGIAASTINTFQGVSEVWRAKSVLPEPFGTAQKVVSTGIVLGSGLKAVQKIASTKVDVPKAEKGALFKIGGKRHSQGGTMFRGDDGTAFEAEKGELIGVMNRNAAALFMDFNNQNNTGSGSIPNYFSDGGIVQRSVQANQGGSPIIFKSEPIDYDLFALKVSDANRQLPPPVTNVQDIIGQVSNYNQVVNGANI